MNESASCSTFWPAFGVVSVPGFGPSNKSVVISHYYFNFHYSSDIWCGTSFHMHICHLRIFFHQVSVKVFSLFFKKWVDCLLLIEFLGVVCIFWIIVLYQMCFSKIFSPSVACLLIHLTLSFTEQIHVYIFYFNEVQLTNYFMNCDFGVYLKDDHT